MEFGFISRGISKYFPLEKQTKRESQPLFADNERSQSKVVRVSESKRISGSTELLRLGVLNRWRIFITWLDQCRSSAGFTQMGAPVQCDGGGPLASAPVLLPIHDKQKKGFFGRWRLLCIDLAYIRHCIGVIETKKRHDVGLIRCINQVSVLIRLKTKPRVYRFTVDEFNIPLHLLLI